MSYQTLDEFIQLLPTSDINNSRSIVRGLHHKAYRDNFAARQLEHLTGIDNDFSSNDVGGDRNHYN